MNIMNYKIEDNFLPEEEYQKIKDYISATKFPWHWNDHQCVDDTFHFSHFFYDHPNWVSDHAEVFYPFLNRLEHTVLFQFKANLNPLTIDGHSNKHSDQFTESMTHKTSVFYLGTNNGVTILHLPDGDVEVNSVDNRLLTFDAVITHSVRHQTDTDRRMVLNINHMRI